MASEEGDKERKQQGRRESEMKHTEGTRDASSVRFEARLTATVTCNQPAAAAPLVGLRVEGGCRHIVH